jgi:hypothetical protein
MKDLSDKPDSSDLAKNLNPDRTVFFFDNKYHTVKNDLLTEIPAEEAEQYLKSPEFDLWNLGSPPVALPESCPSWIYTNIYVKGPVLELLQMLFDLKRRMNDLELHMNQLQMIIDKDETISKN